MVPFLPLMAMFAPPGSPPTLTISASFRSTFAPVWPMARLPSLFEKSTVSVAAIFVVPALSLLVVKFQPLLAFSATSLTNLSCSSVAARPALAKSDSVKVLLVNPVKVPVVPLNTTLLLALFKLMLLALVVLLFVPAVITV